MYPDSSRLLKVLPVGLALISCLFLLHAAGVLSRNIGFFHDELWDFIPAVGMINADSISASQELRIFKFPLPLVSGPYQGALKTWVLAPFLLVFGTAPRLLLSLNVLFAMLYLLVFYWAMLPAVGPGWACLVFATPFLDTNFLLTAPMDTGPTLFQTIFICLTLGALFRYLADASPKNRRLTWFFCGCILAQKLTALPVVLSFVLVMMILTVRPLTETARNYNLTRALRSLVVVPASLFLLPMIPHLIYFLKTGLADLFSMTADGQRVPAFAALGENFTFFQSMFGGEDWFRRITLDPKSPITDFPPLVLVGLLIMALALMFYLLARNPHKTGRFTVVCIALGMISFLLYPAFRGLNRPWHFYILTPLFFGGCILATAHIASCWADFSRKSVAWGRIPCLLVFIVGAVFCSRHSVSLLDKIGNEKGECISSPVLYDVYGALKSSNLKEIFALNYSLAYPIYVLSTGTIRVEDLAWTELTDEKIDEVIRRVKASPDAAVVSRYCGSKEWDRKWTEWLNREPRIFEIMNRPQLGGPSLRTTHFRDGRQTDFVVIRSNRESGAAANRDR